VPPWACLPGRRLGPLHRVMPRIWPYSGKYYELDLGKYSTRPITLSHDGILTNNFLRLKRGTLEMWIAVSRNSRALVAHTYVVTCSIFSKRPLVISGMRFRPIEECVYVY
jgi:hypothetical protein